MDIALHRSSSDIEEDLEYYFSERRDKHDQIRPSDDIRCLTTDSWNSSGLPNKTEMIANAFYPFPPFSLERIFIGISFPLFSNNWGAAFLRYLLSLIGSSGSVILPVYPEAQARDQGLWCRSSLESVFRSRSRFIGASNIWAENDGVMSMRVGRRWPPVISSTARWVFEQAPRFATALGLSESAEDIRKFWKSETQRLWRLGRYHAVIEQIIRDRHGPRRPVTLMALGEDSGILALECLFSPYTRVTQAYAASPIESREELRALDQSCSTGAHGPLERLHQAKIKETCDVLCVTNPAAMPYLETSQLANGGTLILTPECAKTGLEISSGFGAPEFYSDKIARRLHRSVPIYHYSERIEKEIDQQIESRQNAFAVFRKT